MANKPKSGITEFTKALVILAGTLTKSNYDKVVHVMFALHNGVSFGYQPEFDPQMMTDAQDLYKFHAKKHRNNIVKLKVLKGGKDADVKL